MDTDTTATTVAADTTPPEFSLSAFFDNMDYVAHIHHTDIGESHTKHHDVRVAAAMFILAADGTSLTLVPRNSEGMRIQLLRWRGGFPMRDHLKEIAEGSGAFPLGFIIPEELSESAYRFTRYRVMSAQRKSDLRTGAAPETADTVMARVHLHTSGGHNDATGQEVHRKLMALARPSQGTGDKPGKGGKGHGKKARGSYKSRGNRGANYED